MSRRIARLVIERLTPSQKRALKARYYRARQALTTRFRSYGPDELESKLSEMGIADGDTVMVHGGFSPFNGFQGPAPAVAESLLRVLGPRGHLLMASMSYTGSAFTYLRQDEPFRLTRTLSRMGLISEAFRRRPGVVRSLNPVHPVLVAGPEARGLVEGHERTPYPAGPQSPFQRLLDRSGKILFFDARFATCTFLHYIEHQLQHEIPVRLYAEEPIETTIFDAAGEALTFRTYVYDPETAHPRDVIWVRFERQIRADGTLRVERVGNTSLMIASAAGLLERAAGSMTTLTAALGSA